MYKIASILFVLAGLCCSRICGAQIFPNEGSKLNYRIIGFSFPKGKEGNYKLEIAIGHYNTEDSFRRNITLSAEVNSNKVIEEVPAFGTQYTWCVCYNGSNTKKHKLYHFSTMMITEVDTVTTHLRIIKSAEKYSDAYVFLDGTRTLYDMKGHPVWFFPAIDSLRNIDSYPRDLKITPQGTITGLLHKGIYEINYNGKVLWKMPKTRKANDSIEFYHHELTRLTNGHYMVLGREDVAWRKSVTGDSSFVVVTDGKTLQEDTSINKEKMFFGTLIEYDENSKVVWVWKSLDYFIKSDLYYFKNDNKLVDVHFNAFYFDEKNKIIYASFKGIDRIVKLKYPGNEIMNVYGPIYKQDKEQKTNELFCGQHSCRITDNGDLYLFDNNVCDSAGFPKVEIMHQPEARMGNELKKVWEYDCNSPEIGVTKETVKGFPIGGNVVELPGGEFLVSMSGHSTYVFIVDKDKKVLWSAISEKSILRENKIESIVNYRASMITSRKELERLIWNGEKDN